MTEYRYTKRYRTKVRKRLRVPPRVIFWSVLGVILLSAVGYFFLFSPVFQIDHIQVQGNNTVADHNIAHVVEQHLERRAGFLATKSIFLLRTHGIAAIVADTFPRIDHAQLTRRFPRGVLVQVHERQRTGTWCLQETQVTCFALDKEGIVFQAVFPEPETEMVVVPAIDVVPPRLGATVMTPEQVQQLVTIHTTLQKERELPIALLRPAFEEKKITVQVAEGWEIYLDAEGDIEGQLFHVGLVLAEKIPLPERPNLAYIDARFGNRVYFKYKDELDTNTFIEDE